MMLRASDSSMALARLEVEVDAKSITRERFLRKLAKATA